MMLEGEEIEFSDGFTDLHTKSYKNIIDGKGFRISESLKSIKIVHDIRNSYPVGKVGEYHPFVKMTQTKHPFSL
jgi:UDP-N-acetyl-2-amino-2-deoxyglucuronate dehydrogenase